jgi:hypothetical protein
MEYNYSTPILAIKSLEQAYTNQDLDAIFKSKDFRTEAFIILEERGSPFSANDEKQLDEMENLLKIELLRNLQENGFPDFTNSIIEISDLSFIKKNIYLLDEKIINPDGSEYLYKVYMTLTNKEWKVVSVFE